MNAFLAHVILAAIVIGLLCIYVTEPDPNELAEHEAKRQYACAVTYDVAFPQGCPTLTPR